jgi:peptidoglycan/xylan/chitin deacetylase (PgdA/CDA1 family)
MINDHLLGEHKRNKWRVKPEDFEKQMRWFHSNGWTSYTMSELVSLQNIPEKAFVITFDDGYEDNYIHAFPILQKYNYKATIYLVPDYAENSWENFSNGQFDRLLNEHQIHEMQQSVLIEFGSHTMNHKNLLRVDVSEAKQEITDSKKRVKEIIGRECKAFAYPYGKYDQNIATLVKEAGYTNATIVKRGFYEANFPFEIKRIGILGTESFFDFYLKITRVRNKL